MLTPQDRARPLYKWDLKKPGILSLTTPDHEVVAPAAEVRQLCQSSPAAVVYIHSRASTLSKGVLHDAPSLSPGYSKDDVSQLTEVILTVAETFWPWAPGIPMTNSDAGAAVRLADGRLVGFVRENIDAGVPVTYISLAEPLLQSIVGATGARDASFISCWRDG